MSKPDPDNEEWITYNGELRRRTVQSPGAELFAVGVIVALIIGLPALLVLAANDWDVRCLVTTCVKVKP